MTANDVSELRKMLDSSLKDLEERRVSYDKWVEISEKYHKREDFKELVKTLYETLFPFQTENY